MKTKEKDTKDFYYKEIVANNVTKNTNNPL